MDLAFTSNNRRPATNIGLPQWGLTCFYETFVLNRSAVLRLSFSAKNPAHHQYAARYRKPYGRQC